MKLAPIIQSADSAEESPATLKRKNSAEELPKPTTEKRPRLENPETASTLLSQQSVLSEVVPVKDHASCFNCGQPGHYLKDCGLPKAYESKVCFACNEKGHTSKFCPRGRPIASPYPQPYAQPTGYEPYYAYPMVSYPQSNYPNYNYPPHAQPYAAYMGPNPTTDKRCFTCNVRGHTSRDCLEAPLGQKICFNCGSRGHVSKECQAEKAPTKCYTCGQYGHVGKECPEGSLKVCYYCKANDHLSASCNQRPATPSYINCYSCGLTGHKSNECPSHLRGYGAQGYGEYSRPAYPSNQNRSY